MKMSCAGNVTESCYWDRLYKPGPAWILRLIRLRQVTEDVYLEQLNSEPPQQHFNMLSLTVRKSLLPLHDISADSQLAVGSHICRTPSCTRGLFPSLRR